MVAPAVALQFTDGSNKALAALHRDLGSLRAGLTRPGAFRQALDRSVREVMIPSIERNFEEQGRPEKWEPLSPSWLARRLGIFKQAELIPIQLSGGAGVPILQWKGFLKRSATALARWHIAENRATYGNWPPTVFYGPIHDLGTVGNIPQRPFALIQEPEDSDRIVDIFMEFIEEKVDEHIQLRYFGV